MTIRCHFVIFQISRKKRKQLRALQRTRNVHTHVQSTVMRMYNNYVRMYVRIVYYASTTVRLLTTQY